MANFLHLQCEFEGEVVKIGRGEESRDTSWPASSLEKLLNRTPSIQTPKTSYLNDNLVKYESKVFVCVCVSYYPEEEHHGTTSSEASLYLVGGSTIEQKSQCICNLSNSFSIFFFFSVSFSFSLSSHQCNFWILENHPSVYTTGHNTIHL